MPRAIYDTGPYSNILPILDEVLAGWISARGDADVVALACELRRLADAAAASLQHMCTFVLFLFEYVCVCVYIWWCINIEWFVPENMCVCVHVYLCMYVYMYAYIYV